MLRERRGIKIRGRSWSHKPERRAPDWLIAVVVAAAVVVVVAFVVVVVVVVVVLIRAGVIPVPERKVANQEVNTRALGVQ